jgi:hypothetical protein
MIMIAGRSTAIRGCGLYDDPTDPWVPPGENVIEAEAVPEALVSA